MSRLASTLFALVLWAPVLALAEDVAGNFRSDADSHGGTQVWDVSGDPKFWKIKIVFLDKTGKEIGRGHANTATRKGKIDELNFTVIWDQKPQGWVEYPHCLMTIDKDNKDKAKFRYDVRKKEILTGELERVKK